MKYSKTSLILFADFLGFTVADLTELRSKLREKYGDGARFRVVKNTLLNLALKNAEYEGYEEFLKGPTAVLYVTEGDPVEAVKIVYNFYKDKRLIFRGSRVVSSKERNSRQKKWKTSQNSHPKKSSTLCSLVV